MPAVPSCNQVEELRRQEVESREALGRAQLAEDTARRAELSQAAKSASLAERAAEFEAAKEAATAEAARWHRAEGEVRRELEELRAQVSAERQAMQRREASERSKEAEARDIASAEAARLCEAEAKARAELHECKALLGELTAQLERQRQVDKAQSLAIDEARQTEVLEAKVKCEQARRVEETAKREAEAAKAALSQSQQELRVLKEELIEAGQRDVKQTQLLQTALAAAEKEANAIKERENASSDAARRLSECLSSPLSPGVESYSSALTGLHPGTPSVLAKFCRRFDCLVLSDDKHYRQRDALFATFASNGQYLSLAEVCAGILSTLASSLGGEAKMIYSRCEQGNFPLAAHLAALWNTVIISCADLHEIHRPCCLLAWLACDRYYRSFVCAFDDAKDIAVVRGRHHFDDDEYVTRSEFRLLLVYLRFYAMWYEVWLLVVSSDNTLPNIGTMALSTAGDAGDRGVRREAWAAAVANVRTAGQTWAPFIRLMEATEQDFDVIDRHARGFVTFREFCEWVETAEKKLGTDAGLELGVNEPIDEVSALRPHERREPWALPTRRVSEAMRPSASSMAVASSPTYFRQPSPTVSHRRQAMDRVALKRLIEQHRSMRGRAVGY